MKKLQLLERPFYQPTYRIQQKTQFVSVCSPYARFNCLRDSVDAPDPSWESFDSDSLPMYFANGMSLLHMNLGQLENFMRPYSEEEAKNLTFMIESLLQARRLIDAIQMPAEQESVR